MKETKPSTESSLTQISTITKTKRGSLSFLLYLHILALAVIFVYAATTTSTSTTVTTEYDSMERNFLPLYLKPFLIVRNDDNDDHQRRSRFLNDPNSDSNSTSDSNTPPPENNDNNDNNNDNDNNNNKNKNKNQNDANDGNDINPSNKICKNYLKQFLSGSTDVRDECEGLENAYSASNCQSNKSEDDPSNNIIDVPTTTDTDSTSTTPTIDDFFEEFECCQVITRFYSSKCLYHQRYASLSLLGIVTVLILCSLTKTILHSCTFISIQWLPEAGGCIIVGSIVSLIFTTLNRGGSDSTAFAYDSSFNDELFMYILLPPIIFQASLSIHKKQFTKLLFPILMFAVFGTFLSSILVGYIVHYCTYIIPDKITTTIPLLDSMLYGSLISSIDPVATLSILGSMGIATDHVLYVVVFGESILNDGVAIALFDSLKMHLEKSDGEGGGSVSSGNFIRTLLTNGAGNEGDATATNGVNYELVKESIRYFIRICIGSVGIGLLVGFLCTVYFWLLRGKQSPVMEVGTFFCFAFVAYYFSDGYMNCSGIVSIMTAGFIMDIYVRGYTLSERDIEYELGQSGDDGNGGNTSMENHLSSEMTSRPSFMNQWTLQSLHTDLRVMFSGVGHMSHRAKVHVGFVADVLANLMETSIFAYLGLFLFSNKKWDDIPLIIIGILSCVLSRVVMIGITSLFVNGGIILKNLTCHHCGRMFKAVRSRMNNEDDPVEVQTHHDNNDGFFIDRNMQLVLLYSGVRGAVSLALAENIPLYDAVTKSGSQFKPALKAMTSSSIIFTVFFFGASTYFTLKRQRDTLNQTSPDGISSSNIGTSSGGRGFLGGILNREVYEEDDEALYDLTLQDHSRNLTTSLLSNDGGGPSSRQNMPPWMQPSPHESSGNTEGGHT